MGKPLIGILTWREGTRYEEPLYLRQLIQAGRNLGSEVFLFSGSDVDNKNSKIRGFTIDSNGELTGRIFPFPDIVIDRCRIAGNGYGAARKNNKLSFVNSTYTSKWNATQIFMKDQRVSHWIPETVEYSSDNLVKMFKKHAALIVKPGNGTGGRSIVKIKRTTNGYHILGSAKNYKRVNMLCTNISSLITWLDKWTTEEQIRNGNFMIQQYLNLELVPGHVTDTRLLIQKNENGKWVITGLGVRIGRKNSPISNLHGGGKAASFDSFISEKFGVERKNKILKECHSLAYQTVTLIEEKFGQMMEFGLDIGIDANGKIWLIEVNPKPGRDIFNQLGQKNIYQLTVRRPIQYALYLISKKNEAINNKKPNNC